MADAAIRHKSRAKGEPIVEAQELCVELNKNRILHQVSVKLRRGEVTALVGANGCGKTTLLRTIVGLNRPANGKVFLEGREITRERTETICRRIGYLPQDPNSLLFAESVSEELRITLQNHGLAVDEDWIEALLERFGLSDLAHRYPRDLSVGQRQRTALCSILVTKPKVLLLDEPTRGMDWKARSELEQSLREWRSEGKAVMLVTHDNELVRRTADRIVRMDNGAIVEER